MAFDSNHAQDLKRLGTWTGHRCFEHIRRREQAPGFSRGVRIYFPESELRFFSYAWDQTAAEPVHDVLASQAGQVRVVDLIYTSHGSRFSEKDWPLGASMGAERLTDWRLPNGETVWLVHFCWAAVAGALRKEGNWYRQHFPRARKLDGRRSLDPGDEGARIMIAGTNPDSWFAVIDAAAG
jgi:hypothetical protein